MMQIPITDNRISGSSYLGKAGGTNETYIQHDGNIIKVRVDQLWFWTDEWQARHETAVADLDEGRHTVYETGEDLFAAMGEAITRNETRNG